MSVQDKSDANKQLAKDKKNFVNFYKEDKDTAPKGIAGVIHCNTFLTQLPSTLSS
jgi:hypothetical protein